MRSLFRSKVGSRIAKAILAPLLLPLVLAGYVQRAADFVFSIGFQLLQSALFLRVRKGQARARSDAHSLCIFAHYDQDKVVADYVIHYVSQLHAAGCDIVFVSTARLPEVEVEKLSTYCLQIVIRPNFGYDFGSYRTGYDFARDILGGYDRLIFANDSVYGPVRPLAGFFAKLASLEYDITGVTESWEHRYHVQSYFVSFSAKAATSKELTRFLSAISYFPLSKWTVILSSEVALTAKLIKKGFTVGAMYPYSQVRRAFLAAAQGDERSGEDTGPSNGFVNPSHYFWAILVEEFDCPFLKIELLRSNPVGIPVASRWLDLVSTSDNYDPELILGHLKRVNATGGAL